MRKCIRCKKEKDESEFNWRSKDRLLQSVCRDCQQEMAKERYRNDQENVKEINKTSRQKARDEAERFIYEYLSYSVCMDCGEYDFTVLTFDHVKGKKKMNVSDMVSQGYSLSAIKAEIELCEVVCSNCHMRREILRKSEGRFRRFWPKFPWEK